MSATTPKPVYQMQWPVHEWTRMRLIELAAREECGLAVAGGGSFVWRGKLTWARDEWWQLEAADRVIRFHGAQVFDVNGGVILLGFGHEMQEVAS